MPHMTDSEYYQLKGWAIGLVKDYEAGLKNLPDESQNKKVREAIQNDKEQAENALAMLRRIGER